MAGTAKLDPAVELQFEQFRPELTGYCYRMLGSAFEAEDAVQETLVRAWRGFDNIEGRAAVRSWIYRIASNVCFDMLKGRQRRAVPADLNGPVAGNSRFDHVDNDQPWLGPIPDSTIAPATDDPAEQAIARESVRLAFVAALQHLPARQRAVLILREVLRWKASEVAELLETSVQSVNSALQRARATLADRNLSTTREPHDPKEQELLARYVDAFERFDVDAIVALLHKDATFMMPPFPMWMRGADEYATFMRNDGSGCEDSKLAPLVANGAPGFAQWKASPAGGYDAWAIHVLDISDGGIAGIDFFIDPALFPLFGYPVHLDA